MNRTGATLNRGKSKQDYPTPPEFVRAVEARFGKLYWDLAATAENSKTGIRFLSPKDNSLSIKWHLYAGLLWLNPPFSNIAPWARKCRDEARMGAKILFLTPASIGSNWFRDFVHGEALVLALNGRITFVGHEQPYPKDCMLSGFGFPPGFEVWNWTQDLMSDPLF